MQRVQYRPEARAEVADQFGVSSTVDVSSRKNLAQISKVLSQVTSGLEFGDDSPSYIPINEYVKRAILQFTSWLLEGRYSHECTLSCT